MMRLSDFLWFLILATVLTAVAWIGTTMIVETRYTAAAIENAYRIRDWSLANGPRAPHASQVDEAPEDCAPPKGTLAACAEWVDRHPPKAGLAPPICSAGGGAVRDCLAHLVSADGDLKDIQNTFNPQSPVFVSTCSLSDPQTLGGILIYVGKPKSATDSTLEYKPLRGQTLEHALALRLTVCGRLYRPSAPIDFQI